MKQVIFGLIVLFSLFFLFGCTAQVDSEVGLNSGDSGSLKWSEKVASLGNPVYEKVTISSGYEILPFPGLTYNGLRDNWQSFYSTNKDYTFAIYASPSVIENAGTYDEVKQKVMDEYRTYAALKCEDISSLGWLTNAKAFSCSYVYSEYISYKIVTFYKNNSYIQTDLSVWGASLQNYTYIFDEFNQKAVSWK